MLFLPQTQSHCTWFFPTNVGAWAAENSLFQGVIVPKPLSPCSGDRKHQVQPPWGNLLLRRGTPLSYTTDRLTIWSIADHIFYLTTDESEGRHPRDESQGYFQIEEQIPINFDLVSRLYLLS